MNLNDYWPGIVGIFICALIALSFAGLDYHARRRMRRRYRRRYRN